MHRIAAVMASHNRRDVTLRCLRSVYRQTGHQAEITTFLVDDASTDGTSEAVSREFPAVEIIKGDGNLFWNGGMRVGLQHAMAEGFDGYWWLNDDVELDPDALERLIGTVAALRLDNTEPIVTGSVRDPVTSEITYGGVVRSSRLRVFRYSLVEPGDDPVMVDTMHGNCVLIPDSIAQHLGNLSPEFRHAMGDFDYGLRARQEGFSVWLAPGTFGTCRENVPAQMGNARLPQELRRIWSRKELDPQSWLAFARRWGGPAWPMYFVSPYLRRSAAVIADRMRRRFRAAS